MSVLHKCWKAGECRKALISGDGVRFGLQCKAMGETGKNFANRFAVDWSGCGCRAVASIAKRAKCSNIANAEPLPPW